MKDRTTTQDKVERVKENKIKSKAPVVGNKVSTTTKSEVRAASRVSKIVAKGKEKTSELDSSDSDSGDKLFNLNSDDLNDQLKAQATAMGETPLAINVSKAFSNVTSGEPYHVVLFMENGGAYFWMLNMPR